MPKRKNTSIKPYKLKNGETRYQFVISLGKNSNGKRVQSHRRGFKSYAEAEDAFNKLSQTKPDNYVKQKQIKVKDVYDLWFENYKTTVKESTANKNKQVFKNHVNSYFGNSYLDQVTVVDLQKWADNLAKKIVNYRDPINEFSVIFEYGMRLNYVEENPIKRILIPKKTARKRRDIEHNVYSRSELNKFMSIAKKKDIMKYTYFKILSSTGMRKAEVLALTWDDVDLINETISVNRTLAYGLDGKTILQPPKSPKSKRTIPISASLLSTLLKYKKERKIISNKLFHTHQGNYLRLSKPDQWLQSIYQEDHKINVEFAKENNLDVDTYTLNHDLRHITLHGFRHTFATLLISETDIKPKTVQMLLGHENIKMTLDLYTHINKKNMDDALDALSRLNI